MAIFSAIGAGLAGLTATQAIGLAGVGVSALGAGMQFVGAQKAERLRKRQMDLESTRARRNTVRQAVAARASALVSGEAQGALGSSGLAGGLGQVAAQAGSNVQGINQGQDIGNQMFRANSMINIGQTMGSIGGTFQDIARTTARNTDVNYRVWGMAS